MSESQIRAEMMRLLIGLEVGENNARLVTDRIMDMVAEYASDYASNAVHDCADRQ